MSERPIGIGVIGGGSFVARQAVLPAIVQSGRCRLIALSSRSGTVPPDVQHLAVPDYDDVLDHPDVDAVYLPLPNHLHAEWALRAAAAGKHVLCEKPLAPTADEARAMLAACDSAGVLLAEAWMTPFDSRWAQALQLVDDGLIGAVEAIDAAFTFTIGPDGRDNYRWDPDAGGGALLDVGIYCLGAAVRLWGPRPTTIDATAVLTDRGVDASTTAELTWPDGQRLHLRCSFVDAEQQRLEFIGADGRLALDRDAHTGGERATRLRHVGPDGESAIEVPPGSPYLHMVDAFADAVAGVSRWPRPTERAIELLELIGTISEVSRG